MRTFKYKKLKNEKWDSEIIGYIAKIYQEQGKQELYLKQKPQTLDRLVEIAKIQSTEASNEIEGIKTTGIRLKQLMQEKTTPKSRDEEEIAGYRDVLSIIHDSYDAIPLTSNYILQLHKILYAHNKKKQIGGKYKNVQNYISAIDNNGNETILFTPIEPMLTPNAIESICKEYNETLALGDVDPLLLIPIFIHDFLCIHPFSDGNGRMSRLLTTLLLYQSGFFVAKYISLEKIIADNKDLYYDALLQSQNGWHEGKEDIIPFIKYILSIIYRAYVDFENRVDMVSEKLSAKELVKRTIDEKIGKFTKSDICELCPTISINSVEKQLTALSNSGVIVKCGSGKNIYYIKKR